MSLIPAALVSGLLGSTTALVRELVVSDAVVRAPLPLSRRIGFVQLSGGTGTSTVAAYVSSLLAHRRTGTVLAVNGSAGAVNVLSRAGLARSVVAREGYRRSHASTARDAQAGLACSGSGLYGLDLAMGAVAIRLVTWFDQVSPIARFYDVVCTDWGVRRWSVDLQPVAATSHAVCLVARADRDSAEQAASLVADWAEGRDRPPVVVALADVGGTRERTPRVLRDRLNVPVVSIPYEPAWTAARPPSSRHLPARTRLAQIRLATALMQQAAGSRVGESRGEQP